MSGAAVSIDGKPAQTLFDSSSELEVQIPIEMDYSAGNHEFTVQQGSQTSNSSTWTVYSPVQGPQPLSAIPGYFPEGADSGSMAVADVNGDGLADIVMQGPVINGASSLTVMLGQQNGQLAPPIITPGLSAGLIAVADVNGDSTPDIVTATVDANQNSVISILVNDGKGHFTQGSTISYMGAFPGSLTIADMNGDSKPDILFSVKDPTAIYYLQNEGGGSFASPVVLASPTADNRTFLVADFNSDGRPDIVYAANTGAGDQIHLLLNQGGSFVDQAPPGISGQAGYFAVGDFNLDGHMDIAVEPEPPFVSLASVVVQVFLGQGNGSFISGPTTLVETDVFQTFQLVVGDFDDDGFPDIAGVNGDTEPGHVVLLWGDGTGSFMAQDVNGPMGFSLSTGDINGDGIPDVLVPDRFGVISVILGRKDRDFPSATSFRPDVLGLLSAGDVNGDGKPDLLVPDESSTLPGDIYLNQGANQFALAGNPPAQGLLLADLDGDGLADLIGTDGINILIWKGSGSLNFSGAPIGISPPANVSFQAQQMQIADMDGDRRPDIVLPNVILYNQGGLTFAPIAVNFGSTEGPYVIGDFNGDGIMDIASGGFTQLGQGNRSFRTITPNNLNMTGGNYAAVGDFNGDGKTDVVFGGNSYPIEVEYAKGDGTFYLQSGLNVGPVSDFSQSIAVRDFNGDGRSDILACLFLSQQCVLYTNDGQGGFARSYFASGATSVAAISLDLNGDGKPDVVLTNYLLDFRPPNFLVLFAK